MALPVEYGYSGCCLRSFMVGFTVAIIERRTYALLADSSVITESSQGVHRVQPVLTGSELISDYLLSEYRLSQRGVHCTERSSEGLGC